MGGKKNVKKVCSFCVSDWHFVTMITPYINEKRKNNEEIKIFTDEDLSETVGTFLSKLTLNENTKEQIANLNWNKTKNKDKFENIKNNNITFIIKGENTYIEKTNKQIEKWSEKNRDKKITIVNNYEVMQFNNNIEEILDKHDKVLNTSGEKEISEVFDGYEKKTETA